MAVGLHLSPILCVIRVDFERGTSGKRARNDPNRFPEKQKSKGVVPQCAAQLPYHIYLKKVSCGLFFFLLCKFVNELVLQVAGHQFVAGKLHDEAGAATCQRAEAGGIGAHFLEGHLGL